MFALESSEQDNYMELNPGTKYIRNWKLDLAALECLKQNNAINGTNNEGDWCINEDMTFNYVHAYPPLSTPHTTSVKLYS